MTKAGFPTKFVEAISVGTAVIANDTSDLKLYLKDGKNGYMINADKMEENIRKILLAEKDIEVESDTFDYKKYIKKFEDFYSKVNQEQK